MGRCDNKKNAVRALGWASSASRQTGAHCRPATTRELLEYAFPEFLMRPEGVRLQQFGGRAEEHSEPPWSFSGGCNPPFGVKLAGLVFFGTTFVRNAGYNKWADSNGMIVLYPQATATLPNPEGCWDWWGYDDPNYALKSGRQISLAAHLSRER
jgi:hypothetical protein